MNARVRQKPDIFQATKYEHFCDFLYSDFLQLMQFMLLLKHWNSYIIS